MSCDYGLSYILFRGVTHVVIVACNFYMGFHHFLHIYTQVVYGHVIISCSLCTTRVITVLFL